MLFICLSFIFVSPLHADVKLAGVFGDHMILQREMKLAVFGSANPGERVTVKVAGQSVSTKADGEGSWRVVLNPLKPSASPVEFIVNGSNTLILEDVLVGDVWLCSGQSNMVFPLDKEQSGAEELPKADHPGLRWCQISSKAMREPLADRKVNWVICDPEHANHFSAVGYYFGRDIHESTGIPIGLILSAVSGTPAQSWTSLDALKSNPALRSYLDTYDQMKDKPGTGGDPKEAAPGTPTSLFNGMISPFISFGIKGIVWYQGESNTGEAELYRQLFPTLITDWRKHWNEGNIPFLYVQLPGFGRRNAEPTSSNWALLREAQTMALSLPDTGMAVTVDLSPARNILHPRNKREIGRRLALVASHLVYGQNVDCYGPTYKSSKIEGDKDRITFNDIGSGLVMGASVSTDTNETTTLTGHQLKGFSISGADHKFVWADAAIEGDSVIVSSAKVKSPVAVRYGWDDNPEVNLFDKEGLPAVPFRTDN